MVAIEMESTQLEVMLKGGKKNWKARLLDPAFLVALGLLLLNDHVLKSACHNVWTGKLSDFAGLYALAWVGMSMAPRLRKGISWTIAIAFVFWKSPLSGPLIDFWNAHGLLTVSRIEDWSDLVALIVLPLAVWRFGQTGLRRSERTFTFSKSIQHAVLGLSLFAFCATSYRAEYNYRANYELPIAPEAVVQRLNSLSKSKKISNLPLSLLYLHANDFIVEGGVRLYLHKNELRQPYADTTYTLNGDSLQIQKVSSFVPKMDSMFVNPEGLFQYAFAIDSAANSCSTAQAILQLVPNGSGSRLTLLHIDMGNCPPLTSTQNGETSQRFLLRRFVEEVVNVLKQP